MNCTIEKQHYGITTNGTDVERYRLTNNGATVDIITYGGVITSWTSADRNGQVDDIVLGYDTLAEYEADQISMGCLVGRYANRIANGRFNLDGVDYALEQNIKGHHLHGGFGGFQRAVWQAKIEHTTQPELVLSYRSVDGEAGYPGTLNVQVRYVLNEHNELSIHYSATTDKPTVLNLTNHAYFNLRGHQHAIADGAMDHHLSIHAQLVLEVDADSIPTGKMIECGGTAFDFTNPRGIGSVIAEAAHYQPHTGYDHCFVLDEKQRTACLHDPSSGRSLEMRTTLPGVQLYCAEYVASCSGKNGALYGKRGAVCLEAQCLPDSPNQKSFPSTVLRPGEIFAETTSYRLKTR